jgi:hypothetical protein
LSQLCRRDVWCFEVSFYTRGDASRAAIPAARRSEQSCSFASWRSNAPRTAIVLGQRTTATPAAQILPRSTISNRSRATLQPQFGAVCDRPMVREPRASSCPHCSSRPSGWHRERCVGQRNCQTALLRRHHSRIYGAGFGFMRRPLSRPARKICFRPADGMGLLAARSSGTAVLPTRRSRAEYEAPRRDPPVFMEPPSQVVSSKGLRGNPG